jgi:manganese transport protein
VGLSQITAERDVKAGWRSTAKRLSLPEVHGSVPVPRAGGRLRRLMAFIGPGYLISVGYMDPGNWATDIAGGAAFGYTLLSVILLSNLMAILLQSLSAKLGIVTGRDLAQACHDHYSPPVNLALWIACEIAICACDLAEVLGTAIALNLLFGLPLLAGIAITLADVFLILFLQHRGFRWLEAVVITLIAVIGGCFIYEMAVSQPEFAGILAGFVPSPRIVTDPAMLYIAIGILGATVMPHNLYLHSSIVQTRRYGSDLPSRREAVRFATIDSTVALMVALFINAAILIMAAATFHRTGHTGITEIQEAYVMLAPLLGAPLAGTIFALALLAAGQNSTVTATLAGQIVMEGFLNIRLLPWLRRLLTRGIAVVPAFIVTAFYGEGGTADLLIFSQVILSLQLPFAVIPLLKFTGDRRKMGELVNPPWLKLLAWAVAALIVVLNVKLLSDLAGIF